MLVPLSLIDRCDYCCALRVLVQFLDVMVGNGTVSEDRDLIFVDTTDFRTLSQMLTQVLGILELRGAVG